MKELNLNVDMVSLKLKKLTTTTTTSQEYLGLDDTELDEESFGSLDKGESVKKNSYRLRDRK